MPVCDEVSSVFGESFVGSSTVCKCSIPEHSQLLPVHTVSGYSTRFQHGLSDSGRSSFTFAKNILAPARAWYRVISKRALFYNNIYIAHG